MRRLTLFAAAMSLMAAVCLPSARGEPVFKHDRYRVTTEDGHFKFQNLHPGEYNLTMTHPAGGLRSKRKIMATSADEKLAVDIVASPDKDAEATSNSTGR